MAADNPGGYGQELYGDPMGGGGVLHVVRAVPLTSHSVRVVFNEAPLFRTAAGVIDARNAANYAITAVEGKVIDPLTGEETSPRAVGVGKTLAAPPAIGLISASERGVDVHADRALVANVRYRIDVLRIIPAIGGTLGAPTWAEFVGMQPLSEALPVRQAVGYADIAENPSTGGWVVGDDGDLGSDDGERSLRKRVMRRTMTPKGSYSWLPGYGLGIAQKEVASTAELQLLKTDAEQQYASEPEVDVAKVTLTLDPQGVLFIGARLRTFKGPVVVTNMRRQSDGTLELLPT